jgi:hypothetical protein
MLVPSGGGGQSETLPPPLPKTKMFSLDRNANIIIQYIFPQLHTFNYFIYHFSSHLYSLSPKLTLSTFFAVPFFLLFLVSADILREGI